jgi:hypothetical protein
MRLVKLGRGHDGNPLDATGYMDAISAIADQLPPGARAFATDRQQYDFFGRRCVKDLKPAALRQLISIGQDQRLDGIDQAGGVVGARPDPAENLPCLELRVRAFNGPA